MILCRRPLWMAPEQKNSKVISMGYTAIGLYHYQQQQLYQWLYQ